jgi:hypothetical protein
MDEMHESQTRGKQPECDKVRLDIIVGLKFKISVADKVDYIKSDYRIKRRSGIQVRLGIVFQSLFTQSLNHSLAHSISHSLSQSVNSPIHSLSLPYSPTK